MLSKHSPLLRRLAALSVGAVVLVGCGSSSSTKATVPPTTGAATVDTGAADDPPVATAAPATPASVASGAATIDVTVGKDDFETTGGKSVFSVPKGTSVSINVTDPNADNEFHLHGYDVEQKGTKGQKATISVTADKTGQFDLESHTSNKVIVVLVVTG